MNRYVYKIFLPLFILPVSLYSQNLECKIPAQIRDITHQVSKRDYRNPDIRRNLKALKKLCLYKVSFKEGRLDWEMFLVYNPKRAKGAFWFLPHDNENTAFDSAVYAVSKYGGGFLSVISNGHRYHQGQDPNRNFSNSLSKNPSCRLQKYASPIYTKNLFRIIELFKTPNMPYLAIHNNSNGGGLSILKSSKKVLSYPAYPISEIKDGAGLRDEDTLIYIAGKSPKPPKSKLKRLLSNGINTKYEIVNSSNNDCSMSNYIVLEKGTTNYYNLEAQHGDSKTQKKLVDILMKNIIR